MATQIERQRDEFGYSVPCPFDQRTERLFCQLLSAVITPTWLAELYRDIVDGHTDAEWTAAHMRDFIAQELAQGLEDRDIEVR